MFNRLFSSELKNFENRSRFEEVAAMNLWFGFLIVSQI